MTVRPLDAEHLDAFRSYAATHGADDHHCSPDQLAQVVPGSEPAWVALDDAGQVVGACSLMPDQGPVGGARVRVLHALDPGAAAFAGLVTAVREELRRADLSVAELFVDVSEVATVRRLTDLGAAVDRRTAHLERPLPAALPRWPDDLVVREVEPADEQAFVALWRRSQEETRATASLTVQRLRAWRATDGWVCPVAVVRDGQVVATGIVDLDGTEAYAGALSVHPELRGRGLGREMLRELAARATDAGGDRIALAVDGHNDGAFRLYESEGYVATETYVVLHLHPDAVARPCPA